MNTKLLVVLFSLGFVTQAAMIPGETCTSGTMAELIALGNAGCTMLSGAFTWRNVTFSATVNGQPVNPNAVLVSFTQFLIAPDPRMSVGLQADLTLGGPMNYLAALSYDITVNTAIQNTQLNFLGSYVQSIGQGTVVLSAVPGIAVAPDFVRFPPDVGATSVTSALAINGRDRVISGVYVDVKGWAPEPATAVLVAPVLVLLAARRWLWARRGN